MQQSVGCVCFAALLLPYSTLDSTGTCARDWWTQIVRGTNASQPMRMANHKALKFAKWERGPRRRQFPGRTVLWLGQTSLVKNNYKWSNTEQPRKNTTLRRLVEEVGAWEPPLTALSAYRL